MNRHEFLKVGILGVGVLCAPSKSFAQAKVGNVTYPNEVTVRGQILQLNGFGMRFRFGLKGYAAGLYAPNKLATNEQVINPKVTKRLHLVAQRDLKGEELGRLFARGMEDNASKEDFSKIVNGVLRMSAIFSDIRNVSNGESVIVDSVFGAGLSVLARGAQVGATIAEPEFAENFFKIWFGKKPADEALRKALLGEQTSANTNVN